MWYVILPNQFICLPQLLVSCGDIFVRFRNKRSYSYVLQRQRSPKGLYNSCFLKFQKIPQNTRNRFLLNKELHCRCLLFPMSFVKLFRTSVLQKLLLRSVRNILENFQENYCSEVLCFLKSFLKVLDQIFWKVFLEKSVFLKR